MIISETKYCIVSKSFPLRFYFDGIGRSPFSEDVLQSKEECERELSTYDDPESFQVIEVTATYEF